MTDGVAEQLKRFVFTSKVNIKGETKEEKLEVVIPEVLLLKFSEKYFAFMATSSLSCSFLPNL